MTDDGDLGSIDVQPPTPTPQQRYNRGYEDGQEDAQRRIDALEGALRDAIDCVESWGGYASEFLQWKWDLPGDLARLRGVLEKKA